ncbi:MAG: ribonuclease P protein component [Abitibacteriaceae bacterium]|nr:ribonuclease P protein component [Abditibacteriaceae bacterium]
MLPRSQRLKTAAFAQAFNQNRVLRHPLLQLRVHQRCAANQATLPRAAFVVAKKLGKATLRNRTRRRIRERYRLNQIRFNPRLRECDFIFLATSEAVTADIPQLDEAINQLLRRAVAMTPQASITPDKATAATEA